MTSFANRITTDALVYDSNGWGDEQIAALCRALVGVQLPDCKHIWLSHNDITDVGMKTLAECLKGDVVPGLENVHLHGNPSASHGSREEIRAARQGLAVHYDGMGGARENHAV